MPYSWADDIHCLHNWVWEEAGKPKQNCINVFDFHPIHVFINSENLDRYESSREFHRDAEILPQFRNMGFGTKSHLDFLLGV